MNGQHSSVSSVYADSITTRPSTSASTRSTQQQPYRPTYLDYKANGTSTRPLTQPSIHPNQAIPQATRAASQAPAPVPVVANGVLVLAIANLPHQRLKKYVQTALTRARDVSAVLILGSAKQEVALKQFKVDMYALAGSMSRSLDVQLVVLQSWAEHEVQGIVQQVIVGQGKTAKLLRGVICDLNMDLLVEADMLELEAAELEDSWKGSVGFVHAVARSTAPLLRIAEKEEVLPTTVLRSAFFITTLDSERVQNGSVNEQAVGALIRNMSTSGLNRNITFGSADQFLIPDPEPVPTPAEQNLSLEPTEGYQNGGAHYEVQDGDESPTKLWAHMSSAGYF